MDTKDYIQANITRDEASALINKQLDGSDNTPEKGEYWHYGRQELKELLDAIYGPPQDSNSDLINEDKEKHKYPPRNSIDQSMAVKNDI